MVNSSTSSGMVVNYHEHVQAFHNKEYSSLATRMKATSRSRMRTNNIKEFCVRKTRFTCGAIAPIEKRENLNTWETKLNNPVADATATIGSLVQDGLVYRENFVIRSSEIGFDGKISLATLSNYLQDTALNHSSILGLLADGLGLTPEMSRKDLIWVLSTLKLVMDRYPTWLDVVQVDTWMYQSGKNGLGRDWIFRDGRTGETVAHATSISLLMNKKTRKLSKFAKEIKEELVPHMMDCNPRINNHARKKLHFDVQTADYSCTGLRPGWNDLDLNQHVNHAKYINWILQNIPRSFIEHHNLSTLALEYRKECNTDSTLQSLSKIVKSEIHDQVEFDHLLLLENGLEIVRGSTIWKPRDHENGLQ
ncbi:Myristoyl-acyl carrier protein thioesterase, chloroplast precursor, putative [Ricinus communis]|uniref:Acyl-[acyl-carrier-protein] hydrolase n=2 Tax=Ricinus communis TaxID=3988 RepID=B9RUV6_RICCO|nr:Myristoyl-acyl carrier protein thioesterase, chloroplast precursor, putative [Ricinus communis]|eukprot:XP_002517525.1 palmitoyl-acyl carrier protein thioesterase, chloroplastic [Ricinus communis]